MGNWLIFRILKINISAFYILCDILFLFKERRRIKNNLGGMRGL